MPPKKKMDNDHWYVVNVPVDGLSSEDAANLVADMATQLSNEGHKIRVEPTQPPGAPAGGGDAGTRPLYICHNKGL